jgi:hypothetical protein
VKGCTSDEPSSPKRADLPEPITSHLADNRQDNNCTLYMPGSSGVAASAVECRS